MWTQASKSDISALDIITAAYNVVSPDYFLLPYEYKLGTM